MNLQPISVEGTLHPDGTLQLDQKVNLSPGRVQVVVQPLPKTRGTGGLGNVMDEVRASQQARGHRGRTFQEMQAEELAREEENDDYDRRSEELWGGSASP